MNVHIFATITLTGSLQVWDLRQPFTSIWSLTTGSMCILPTQLLRVTATGYALRLCWPQQNLMGGCFEDGSLRIIAINVGCYCLLAGSSDGIRMDHVIHRFYLYVLHSVG